MKKTLNLILKDINIEIGEEILGLGKIVSIERKENSSTKEITFLNTTLDKNGKIVYIESMYNLYVNNDLINDFHSEIEKERYLSYKRKLDKLNK